MKKTVLFFAFTFFLSSFGFAADPTELKPSQALHRLMQGNKRYVNSLSEHVNKRLVSGQSPFAIIVGCSDSRVSPEIIFDEGLGDLFVVRVAGNVVGPIELESIEFAAVHLKSPIIIVLGHENCGAVSAVLQDQTADLKAITQLIEPAVQEAEKSKKENMLEVAIKDNASNMKEIIEKNASISKLIQEKAIEVHAAYYNLKTGVIEFL